MVIRQALSNDTMLVAMQEAGKRLGKPDAASDITNNILELIEKRVQS